MWGSRTGQTPFFKLVVSGPLFGGFWPPFLAVSHPTFPRHDIVMVHMILTGGHARRPILVLVRGMTFIIRPFRLQGSGPRRVGKVWKKALTRWFVERWWAWTEPNPEPWTLNGQAQRKALVGDLNQVLEALESLNALVEPPPPASQ